MIGESARMAAVCLGVMSLAASGCTCGGPGTTDSGGSDSTTTTDMGGTDAVSTDTGGTDTAVTDMGATDANTDSAMPMCATGGSSNLPDVTIEFPAQPCVFTLAQAAAGITIDYDVVVANMVTGVIPAPQDAGQCDGPGSSGLITFERLDGGGQSYCICDQGAVLPAAHDPHRSHRRDLRRRLHLDGQQLGRALGHRYAYGTAVPGGPPIPSR